MLVSVSYDLTTEDSRLLYKVCPNFRGFCGQGSLQASWDWVIEIGLKIILGLLGATEFGIGLYRSVGESWYSPSSYMVGQSIF